MNPPGVAPIAPASTRRMTSLLGILGGVDTRQEVMARLPHEGNYGGTTSLIKPTASDGMPPGEFSAITNKHGLLKSIAVAPVPGKFFLT